MIALCMLSFCNLHVCWHGFPMQVFWCIVVCSQISVLNNNYSRCNQLSLNTLNSLVFFSCFDLFLLLLLFVCFFVLFFVVVVFVGFCLALLFCCCFFVVCLFCCLLICCVLV
jgi:hypothetical protein